MAIDKQALVPHKQDDEDLPGLVDQGHTIGPLHPDAAVETRGRRLLTKLAHNLHYVTFLPLVIISVLQDVHLLLAAVICTSLVAAILLLSFCCWRAGIVKVFPKPFDLFNLSLYGSMILLAIFAHDWLRMYVGLLTNAGNACFMWATILLPCMDNFVMHSIRDRVPDHVARLPLMRRMALLISLTWAVALTLMTAGAAIPVAAKLHPTKPHPANIIATYVLGFGPLLLALPVQLIITHVYKKRMMQLQRQEVAALAAAQPALQQQPGRQPGHSGDNVV